LSEESPNNLSPAGLPVLLTSVFIIATCGILYELLISSISTYFLGSSILQFSITIGLFMSFMGVGSYISRYFQHHLLDHFITIEILLGLIGGSSAFILYLGYSLTENYYLIAFLLISTLGTFIGLEIPLVTRIVRGYTSLKDTVAQVLSFDYIGALLASIIFPLVLLPYLGTMRTSFLIGVLNLSVAGFNSHVFRKGLRNWQKQLQLSVFLALLLTIGFFYSFRISSFFEQYVYQDEIILTEQSPYQRIVLTRWNQDYRLYINGNLQFSTVDEYRYHEPLVHIPMALANNYERVLILGGGDGLAAREVLKHPGVQHIDLVDLDPAMTRLARAHPVFRQLNSGSLSSAKVSIYHEDAFTFVRNASHLYSLILIDLPDPNDTGLGKLYTREFYFMLQKRLAADGIVATQATSPYFAPEAFWCIVHTMQEVFPEAIPYHSYVPSFGQWGFVLAGNSPKELRPAHTLEPGSEFFRNISRKLFREKNTRAYQFLTPQLLPSLFVFAKDTEERPTGINTLETQILVRYYEESLQNWE
jgi:spermidine synthase